MIDVPATFAGSLAARAGIAAGPAALEVAGPRVPPRALFKYMEIRWARAMIAEGAIRVGTARGYAGSQFERGRHDPNEGVGEYLLNAGVMHQGEMVFFDKRAKPNPLDQAIARRLTGQSSSGAAYVNCRYGLAPEDALVYCTTTRPARHLYREFEANAIVKITDPLGFMLALTEAIWKAGYIREQAWEAKAVSYRKRPLPIGYGLADHPLFIKDLRFVTQNEFRMAWSPSRIVEKPLDLVVPSLRQYCRITEVLREGRTAPS